MDHFIDAAAMIELTGYKLPKYQIDVLIREKIPYTLDIHGVPKTTWYAYNQILVGKRYDEDDDHFNIGAIDEWLDQSENPRQAG